MSGVGGALWLMNQLTNHGRSHWVIELLSYFIQEGAVVSSYLQSTNQLSSTIYVLCRKQHGVPELTGGGGGEVASPRRDHWSLSYVILVWVWCLSRYYIVSAFTFVKIVDPRSEERLGSITSVSRFDLYYVLSNVRYMYLVSRFRYTRRLGGKYH